MMHTQSPVPPFIRPVFTGAIAVVSVVLMTLTACSPNSLDDPDREIKPLTVAAFQLGWIPNVESMAPITASAEGYFTDEGVDVDLLPGGPEVTTDAQIVSGNALMGTMSSEALANSVIAGAPLVAIGATYQTSSTVIVSLEEKQIREPQDLEGKRFGLAQTDARIFSPFFTMLNIDESKIRMVTSGTDPAALISGEVDAMSGTIANQPVAIEALNIKTNVIRLADYGYNRWSNLLVVHKDSLEDPEKRATVRAMLRAVTKGLERTVADPQAGADIVFSEYGEQLGLDLEQQRASATIWAELAAEGTESQGLMRVTEEGINDQQNFFDAIGLSIDASALFDVSVQEES